MTHDHFCPRLIEVALPIREISAESVRDKSLRHGHISTLHLWWARRPLAASRAVVFASLVPDPDDPRCPEEFRRAVEKYLKTGVSTELKYYRRGRDVHRDEDPYHPYEGIPDTLRNRLLTFIAKWSPEALAFESGKSTKEPKPAEHLDDRSLVKWETSNPDNPQGQEVLRIARELVKVDNGGKAPTVLDPFAGGGAIPLEASRLGCQAIANDYNPVAYLILRATCEFPQRFGKPGRRKQIVEEFGTKIEREVEVPNVLVYDIERWSNWILKHAWEEISHLYPPGKDKRPIIGYIWARTASCSNPSCKGEIPLLRSLIICDLRNNTKRVALTMHVDKPKKEIQFGIARGKDIKQTDGTMLKRGNALCPFCGQITPVDDLRTSGLSGNMGERMVTVILEDKDQKDYRPVEEVDLKGFERAVSMDVERPKEKIYERIVGIPSSCIISPALYYGMPRWGDLFNSRQLVVMQTFLKYLQKVLDEIKKEIEEDDYCKVLGIYLGLLLDRISQRGSNVGVWHTGQETFEHPFGRQAIPMTWDYPEANPFSYFAQKTMSPVYMLDVIKRESGTKSQPRLPALVSLADAAYLPTTLVADVVVTDPPYFDAIAYADLSDYFYIWLKRSLSGVVPEVFVTPVTPKDEEATALKHHHEGDEQKADSHFKLKLAQALKESQRNLKPGGIICVMFAHQSNKAWTALVHAILEAGLTVNSTWPIDTEKTYALKNNMSVLSSSITVTCRQRIIGSGASFKDVRKEIEKVVQESVKRFWGYGLRGADLIVACYGPAVGVFGKYERVEKADGAPVEIPELLELARIAARDAIAGEFRGDNLSTLYYVWANLYGAAEQAWDDARLVVQIGGDAESAMEVARGHGIFVVDGSKCRLALLVDREKRRGLGIDPNPPLIDTLHHSMLLWREEKRPELVRYLGGLDLLEDGPFWKLAQALFEVLPRDTEDWKIINALLGERETLRVEGKRAVDSELPLFGLQR